MPITRYFLGLPIWSFKDWTGELFRSDAKPGDFLSQYAAVFNTVEGNTTFYATPNAETVARWRADTPESFRFCFKIPQTITHGLRLRHAEAETRAFFERMAPLAGRLGPFLVQLPPAFGPADLAVLRAYLLGLPPEYEYSVEVRHHAFFAGGEAERALNDLLAGMGIDRVIFDTRALRTADPADPAVKGAQTRKPDLPVHIHAIGPRPLYRYVGHPALDANLPYLETLAEVAAGWIAEGRTPYVFIHNPYDAVAPHHARAFHQMLAQRVAVGEMSAWPGEQPPVAAHPDGQLSLF